MDQTFVFGQNYGCKKVCLVCFFECYRPILSTFLCNLSNKNNSICHQWIWYYFPGDLCDASHALLCGHVMISLRFPAVLGELFGRSYTLPEPEETSRIHETIFQFLMYFLNFENITQIMVGEQFIKY